MLKDHRKRVEQLYLANEEMVSYVFRVAPGQCYRAGAVLRIIPHGAHHDDVVGKQRMPESRSYFIRICAGSVR